MRHPSLPPPGPHMLKAEEGMGWGGRKTGLPWQRQLSISASCTPVLSMQNCGPAVTKWTGLGGSVCPVHMQVVARAL